MGKADLTPTFGVTALNVRPAPWQRSLARAAGRICAPLPRTRRSPVPGAGKALQWPAKRDERHGRRLIWTGADRAAFGNRDARAPSYRGHAPARSQKKHAW